MEGTLNAYQQAEIMKFQQDQQIKTSIKLFNKVVETCYDKCISVGYWSGVRLEKYIK